MVFSGLVTACRLATCPTSRSPVLENATTEGVVRPPSALAMTVAASPSMTATHELVVPRSIPMILATLHPLVSRVGLESCLVNADERRPIAIEKTGVTMWGDDADVPLSRWDSPAAGDLQHPGGRLGAPSRRLLYDAAHLRRHRRRPTRTSCPAPRRIAPARAAGPTRARAPARRAHPRAPRDRPPGIAAACHVRAAPAVRERGTVHTARPRAADDRSRLHDHAHAARSPGGEAHPLPG